MVEEHPGHALHNALLESSAAGEWRQAVRPNKPAWYSEVAGAMYPFLGEGGDEFDYCSAVVNVSADGRRSYQAVVVTEQVWLVASGSGEDRTNMSVEVRVIPRASVERFDILSAGDPWDGPDYSVFEAKVVFRDETSLNLPLAREATRENKSALVKLLASYF